VAAFAISSNTAMEPLRTASAPGEGIRRSI
jgi:hypothetical protein